MDLRYLVRGRHLQVYHYADDFAYHVSYSTGSRVGVRDKSLSLTSFGRSKSDSFFSMEGKMANFYTGRFALKNLTRHKRGKYDEFSEIMEAIKIKLL